MSKSVPLVLASGSPRRKDLLIESGYVFDVVIPEVEELDDPDMDIQKLTALNAKLKAEAISANFQTRRQCPQCDDQDGSDIACTC